MTKPLEVSTASSIRVSELVVDSGAVAPVRLMQAGEEGVHVQRLQDSLARVGHPATSDAGKFDAGTRRALVAFQKEKALPATGAYDPPTRNALRRELAARVPKEGPTLRVGTHGEAIRTLETQLKKRGLLEGPVDDVFDAKTKAAVQKLEKKLGAKADGVADADVWRELGGAGKGSGPLLKLGDKGLPVVALQNRLRQAGLFEGKASGTFDAATERAVKAFEKKQGLPVDGRAGSKVWAALGTHAVTQDRYAGPSLKLGQQGGAVRLLEQKLKRRGFLEGKVDGKFDAQTKAAVQKLEQSQGWKTDGVVGNGVWLELGGAGKGSGPVLAKGSDNAPAVKVLQKRLSALGFYKGPADGDFGPMTEAAVKGLEKKHGLPVDGKVGQKVWRVLERHVVANPAPPATSATEPAHNYRRVREDAGWINVRTQVMLRRAEEYARKMGVEKPFYIVQGSYTSGVSASGGTHDGGGALDIRTWDRSRADVSKMVKALRMAGFAAWKRGYSDSFKEVHIHAIAIGDRQVSSSARNQVAEYFRGGDGLIGSAADGDRDIGRPYPKWAEKYR